MSLFNFLNFSEWMNVVLAIAFEQKIEQIRWLLSFKLLRMNVVLTKVFEQKLEQICMFLYNP